MQFHHNALRRAANRIISIPAGLILLLNDTAIPEGWERFASADEKFIVGAGGDYAIGQTGALNNLSVESSTAGAHTGSGQFTGRCSGGGSSWSRGLQDSSGDHYHIVDMSDYVPEYQDVVMIKALLEQAVLPPKAGILSGGAINGLSNIFTDGRLLRSNTDVNTGGGKGPTHEISTSGAHIHEYATTPKDFGPVSSGPIGVNAGAHSGSVTSVITPAIKRKILSVWTDALAEFPVLHGMIGMWESAAPPAGWLICDGSTGTPDLRDYFIEMAANGDEDLDGLGNNSVDIAAIADSNHTQAHDHDTSDDWGDSSHDIYHSDTNAFSHTHSWSISGNSGDDAYLPPYYALNFIIAK